MQKSEQRRILKCWLLDILCAKAHFPSEASLIAHTAAIFEKKN